MLLVGCIGAILFIFVMMTDSGGVFEMQDVKAQLPAVLTAEVAYDASV